MNTKQVVALSYGWIVSFSFIFLASIILALLLRFTTFDPSSLAGLTLVIGIIALFFGGIIAGIKGKEKGWIIGFMTGVGFSALVFLVQYLGYKQGFSAVQSLYHVGYITAALVGGVIGVNLTSAKEK